MGFIITQSETPQVSDLNNIDVMISLTDEEIHIFDTYRDAQEYLMLYGIRELRGGFPFNIKIENIQ
tara:strand:- start:252 stop:449 length:198 start_codon:yes stop_codon:yes gene_type:complete